MKATDLMIGDWVCFDGDTSHECPVQIDGISKEEAGVDGDWYDIWEPIPLTPENLEKNGMSRNPYGEYFAEDKHCFLEISREPEGFFWTINANEYGIIPLNYVHELQHALKLCGIEKEVVV